MFQVEIKNACPCSIKRGLCDTQSFDTKEDAKEEAERIVQLMQDEFCKKHRFELKSEFGNFVIYTYTNS